MPLSNWLPPWLSHRPRVDRPAHHPHRTRLTVQALEDRSVPAAFINNGVIQLGVNNLGNLNVTGGPISQEGSTTLVGLRYLPTGSATAAGVNYEATAQGAPAEGWGVADVANNKAGYANAYTGSAGLTLVSFTSTASSAKSVVDVNGTGLRVTQEYRTTPLTPNLYEVAVTIENGGTTAVSDLRYRRSMDWDIEPTSYSEYVTLQGWGVEPRLFRTSDNGFANSNPLAAIGSISAPVNQNFTDSGPDDHGAVFDFALGSLAAGQTTAFNIYYGGAPTESAARAAVTAVSASVYSLGQNNLANGHSETGGGPVTFIFAFGNLRLAAANTPPDANDDAKTTPQGTPLTFPGADLLANDTDADGNALTITGVSAASSNGGTVGIDPVTFAVTYTPPAGFSGSDTFTYTISDGLATDTATVTVTVTPTVTYSVAGFDVQKGQTQRSYVRYADLTFAPGGGSLQTLIDTGRIKLTRYNLAGAAASGSAVDLTGALSVAGNTIAADFGAPGIGGNPNTTVGDGYYTFALDLDGNGSFETTRSFYRLLGDVDGDRDVDGTDANLILAAYGTTNPERNVNGDGVVNATDRTLAIRSNGKSLGLGLTLDD